MSYVFVPAWLIWTAVFFWANEANARRTNVTEETSKVLLFFLGAGIIYLAVWPAVSGGRAPNLAWPGALMFLIGPLRYAPGCVRALWCGANSATLDGVAGSDPKRKQ